MADFLRTEGLETNFKTPKGIVHALNGVNIKVLEGEIVGLLGESGSGKSELLSSIINQIIPLGSKIISGRVFFRGQDLTSMAKPELAKFQDKYFGIIKQDFATSWDMGASVGKQISDRIILNLGKNKDAARSMAVEILGKVGFPDVNNRIDDNPSNLSFGILKLAAIANAIVCNPKLLILDEPFAGLDAIHQAQIIELMKQMREDYGLTSLIASHDPGVIASVAQWVIVLCSGYIVEEGSVMDLFLHPEHPYTLGLFGSLRRFNDNQRSKLDYINGFTPIFMEKPKFCPFVSRCKFSINRCKVENPTLEEVGIDHRLACWVDLKTGRARI